MMALKFLQQAKLILLWSFLLYDYGMGKYGQIKRQKKVWRLDVLYGGFWDSIAFLNLENQKNRSTIKIYGLIEELIRLIFNGFSGSSLCSIPSIFKLDTIINKKRIPVLDITKSFDYGNRCFYSIEYAIR